MIEVDGSKNTVKNLFENSFYSVPSYQRPYAWTDNQRELLLEDIVENDSGYFLGTFIVVRDSEHASQYNVIDGQQRMTTISILLIAIIFILDSDESQETIKTWTKQRIRKYRDLEVYLRNALVDGDTEKPRFTSSIERNNSKDLKTLYSQVDLIEETISQEPNFGNRRIAMAFNFFVKNLKGYVDQEDKGLYFIIEVLEKILNARVVVLKSISFTDAFTLFNSLNNRGMPLTAIDILKNHLMMNLDKSNKKSDLDQANENWKKISEAMGESADQIRFLRHYYHAFPEPFSNNEKVERAICQKTKVIDNYSVWVSRTPERFLEKMIFASSIYGGFVNFSNRHLINPFVNEFEWELKELQAIGIAPFYAFILYVFDFMIKNDKTDSSSKCIVSDILLIIKNWAIRRNITNYPATSSLDRLALDLLNAVAGEEDTSAWRSKIESVLNKNRSDDNSFAKSILELDLYKSDACKSILLVLENSLRSGSRETQISYMDFFDDKKNYSIEHIFPQKPKKGEWPLFEDVEIESYLHKLGNLTITGYNSRLSNKSFQEKYDHEHGFNTGNIKLNDFIKAKKMCDLTSDWGPLDIEERGKNLADILVSLV